MGSSEESSEYIQGNNQIAAQLLERLPQGCSQIEGIAAIRIPSSDGCFVCRHYPERGWFIDAEYYLDPGEAAQAIQTLLRFL